MSSEAVRAFGSLLFAALIEIGGFWFLYQAYLNPDTAVIPDAQAGLITGLVATLMGGAATFVFGAASGSAAARQTEKATQAGVSAALTQPPTTTTVDAGPPVTVTTTPSTTPPDAEGDFHG